MLTHAVQTIALRDRRDRAGDGTARIVGLRIEPADDHVLLRSTSRAKITLEYESDQPLMRPSFMVSIYDTNHIPIYYMNSDHVGGLPETLPARGSVSCITDPLNITPDRCYLNVSVRRGGAIADYLNQAAIFDIEADDFHGTGKIPDRDRALCMLNYRWIAND